MRKGISEIATMALYIGISVTAVSTALTVGLPALENQQEAASIRNAENFMQRLDSSVEAVVSEGEGSSRTIRVNFDRGNLQYDNSSDSLVYKLESGSGVISPQTSRRTGNVILSSNANVEVSETSVDGTDCFMMENDYLKTCIKKVGNQTNPVELDTSELMILYESKSEELGNQKLNGTLTVTVNENPSAGRGNGFTYAPETGSFIGTGRVISTVYTDTYTYDVIFSLPTGSDFIQVDVQNFR